METEKTYYIAYGSNMNHAQMACRCPSAEVVGITELKDYRLLFRGNYPGSAVATIEPEAGMSVPVLVWTLTREDEQSLDRCEGYPHIYGKKKLTVNIDGRDIEAMVYVMNVTVTKIITMPSDYYFGIIRTGYEENGLSTAPLDEALDYVVKRYYFNS